MNIHAFIRLFFLSGDRTWDLPQLDWKPGDQQDLGALLVNTHSVTQLTLGHVQLNWWCWRLAVSLGWTRVTRSTWRGWSAGVWRANSSDSLTPWADGRTCRTPWEPAPRGNVSTLQVRLLPKSFVPQVNTFGANNPLTNLVPNLQEVDPDDAFSTVPYEKGFTLLYHLEELLGGPGNSCSWRITWPRC